MAIVVNPFSRKDEWVAEFKELFPNEELWVWPNIGDPEQVEYLIAWIMSRKDLASFTNLKAILCLGAGTEQWQKPGTPDVPVVRLADPAMANEMAAYALAWVIRHQRGFAAVQTQQRERRWEIPPHTQAWKYRVGLLGYGEIGSTIGRAFSRLDYPVNTWSRSGRTEAGMTHYAGPEQLDQFLANSDAVINVLPSTPATTGLLDADRLAQFVDGSIFVNVGRGTVLEREQDLIDALDHGPLAAAVLDVTNPEPPAQDSLLYSHSAVTLTPHLSGATQVRSAARLVAKNVAKLRAGESVEPLLDRSRGY